MPPDITIIEVFNSDWLHNVVPKFVGFAQNDDAVFYKHTQDSYNII